MTSYELHTAETAPDGGREAIERAEAAFGFAPNLVRLLAAAPAAANAYLDIGERLGATSFSPAEQQVVVLAVSFDNECTYCMAAHSTVAKMVGIPDADLDALRAGQEMSDPRQEALRRFTIAVVRKRGHVSQEDIESFFEAGFDKTNILEVMVGVAMKTLSNYTNHIAHTPVDQAFDAQRWSPPSAQAAD